jgi:hypothetical protein
MRFVLLTFFFLNFLLAQAQLKVGHLTYSIEFSSDEPDLSAVLSMLEGSKMEVYFKDNLTRSEMNMGSIMSIATITDSLEDAVVVLMDGLSGKTALKSSISEMEMILDTAKMITNYEEEFKDVLGFNCQKVSVKDAFGEETFYWVTNEIYVTKLGQNYLSEEVNGFPMEFELNNNGLKMKLKVQHFEGDLDEYNLEDLFTSYIPKAYKIVTKEQLFQLGF